MRSALPLTLLAGAAALAGCAAPLGGGIAQAPYLVCRVSDGAAIVVFQSSQALIGTAGVGAALPDANALCKAMMPQPAAPAASGVGVAK